jgi:uncharacterized membrane protein YphA (DoxX/SURF4 family)
LLPDFPEIKPTYMSIFFKAKGSFSVGLFIVRLTLGTYMLSLGIMQASNIERYINKVKSLQLMNENLSFIIGFLTPFLLIIFGALFIIGFFTPVSSFMLGLIQFGKIITRGFFVSDGIPFNKEVIFLVCFILVFFAGAGRISFDVFLDRKKKPKLQDSPTTATVTAEIKTETVPEEKHE